MELLYADQFSVDYYDNGFAMITIADDNRYLVVPEGETVPGGLPDGVTVIDRNNKSFPRCGSALRLQLSY